jgi:hypothetical protein
VSEHLGQNLLFLVSQPRAGSTLLQRILGAHPEIYTVSEPWLLLHPVYALRTTGYSAEYNASLARLALREFLGQLQEGDEAFYESARMMYSYLYERALANGRGQFFLDKTPRYYLILNEICRLFPRARIILLLRNPLAVLASVVRGWSCDRGGLERHRADLLEAPGLLRQAMTQHRDRTLVTRYENLVRDPAKEVTTILHRLGLAASGDPLEYAAADLPRWRFGNQDAVYEHDAPREELADQWRDELGNAQGWRLAHDYLHHLGRDTFNGLGYAYEDLHATLEEHRPAWPRQMTTLSLDTCMRLSAFYGRSVRQARRLVKE